MATAYAEGYFSLTGESILNNVLNTETLTSFMSRYPRSRFRVLVQVQERPTLLRSCERWKGEEADNVCKLQQGKFAEVG